jgi:hypothetical protein
MKIRDLPLLGVIASLVPFTLAALRYPGGYDWTRQFVSTLFWPVTPMGAPNAARPLAVAAMFVFCLSVGVLFELVSRRATVRALGKTLQTGGIGAAVYGFLAVTPLHDLMVEIALGFFVVAMVAALRLAALEGRPALLAAGALCLSLLVVTAVMYYGKVFWIALPIAQKASMSSCIAWVLVLHHGPWKLAEDKRVAAS